MASPFSLPAYLTRLGLPPSVSALPADLRQLSHIMGAHSRAIPFENLSCVLRQPVSMSLEDVHHKLVTSRRGGYCFEQNVLLQAALRALGFESSPLLCRVRWNKAPEEVTAFTHMALRVRCGGAAGGADAAPLQWYLADVGFAGTNSIAPIAMGAPAQVLPEGRFRTVVNGTCAGYETLQWERSGVWRDLYMWRTDEEACAPDLAMSNHWSCTSPSARFTTSFFLARVVGEARHHILDGRYVVRGGLAGDAATEEVRIRDEAHLEQLLREVFGVEEVPSELLQAWTQRFRG